LFNAFSYPTKISPEAIAVFVATHTAPGSLVLDTFAGSGTTGLAVLLCDRPTDAMKRMAASLRLKPRWGPRRAILYEIGTLGAFIAQTMCQPPKPSVFEDAAKRLVDRVTSQNEDLYTAIDPDGKKGHVRHIIWSDVLTCPRCRKETSFWESVVNIAPVQLRTDFHCPHCRARTPVDFAKRVTEKYYDPLLSRILTRKKRIPVMVYGQTDGKSWRRFATRDDQRRLAKIARKNISAEAPIEQIAWGDLYRAGYHTGITHLHHFYTYRNFLAIHSLWQAIEDEPPEMRNALRLLVLSYNAAHSTLMTRVVVKNGQKDFVLTGAQSGVLYISSLPVEKNVFQGVRRKMRTFAEAFSLLQGSRSEVEVHQASSTRIDLPDESVDYVFTDPPFGDFIPYAELNQINEIWLGKTTDRRKEIIVSLAQGKSVERYGSLMRKVLEEIARTLKKSGKATIVFHSSKAEIWQALTEAYEHAGLGVKAASILDKIQESFKQVVSAVSVKGDPLLLLEKRKAKKHRENQDIERKAIISTVLLNGVHSKTRDLSESTPQRMYSRFVTRCLEQGIPVAVDADAFYKMVPEKLDA